MPTPNNAMTPACLPRGVALPAGRVAGGLFLQHVSAKGDGVNVFHGSYFLACKPLNATQLNGEVL